MLSRIKNFIKSRWGIVSNWRCWWKWISNQLTMVGSAIVAFSGDLSAFAHDMILYMDSLPISAQNALGEGTFRVLGLILVISSIPARITVQKRLPQEDSK